MGELEEAIREHLELKRRRGADPAEVEREEHEALAPVTRSHQVIQQPPLDEEEEVEPAAEPEPALDPSAHEPAQNGALAHSRDSTPEDADDDLEDATQEYLIAHEGADWLDDDELA